LIELHQAGDEIGLIRELDRLLHWSDFGLHLSKPWSIVLTGRPNVGKSSLINGLLGYQRAIVFDQPGTTRDIVTGETAFEGWPVVLADTAGLRSHAPELEAAGIALARERLRVADLKLVLLDLSQSPTAEDFELLSEYPEGLVVAHKCDLADRWGDQLPHGVFRVSSVTGEGMAALQQQLVSRLVPKIPPKETPIPLTQPQVEMLDEIRRASTITARDQGIQRVRLICRAPTPLPEIAQNGSK
jgi:tRNA modification GTPase